MACLHCAAAGRGLLTATTATVVVVVVVVWCYQYLMSRKSAGRRNNNRAGLGRHRSDKTLVKHLGTWNLALRMTCPGAFRMIGSKQAGVEYIHSLYPCIMYADVSVHLSA